MHWVLGIKHLNFREIQFSHSRNAVPDLSNHSSKQKKKKSIYRMKYWATSYSLKNRKMSYNDSGRTGFQIPDGWSPNRYKYVLLQEFLIWCQWSPSTRVSKLWPVVKSGTPSTFVNIVFFEMQSCPFVCFLAVVAFVLQQQRCNATKTICPQS